MKRSLLLLASVFTFGFLLIVGVTRVEAAGWVDHKFQIELPDGTKKPLQGAKMHVFHQQHQDTGANAFTNTCYYPDFPPQNENSEWGAIGANIGGYHCSTPSSCTIIDYGAPFLPKDFNTNSSVYSQGNASYFAFYNKTFTQELQDSGYGDLAQKYQNGNIRGFDGAKWQGTVNFSENDSKGPVAIVTDQGEIDRELNARADWGRAGFDGATHRWGPGEVYKDPQGGNALHGQITWILKPPPIEKPTATLTGKCANNSPGVPTYTYTLSNINLKGQQFADNHLYLRIAKLSTTTDEIKREFGPPIYENNQFMEYSLIFNTTAPTNNSITMTVNGAEGIGNQDTNKKTVADFVAWADKKREVGALLPPFEIATNLRTKTGETFNTTDYISATFRPKFQTNECGTPPPTTPPTGGGSSPVCLNIKMQNLDGATITNFNALQAGQGVKFACGTVTGVNQYKFQVVRFDAQNRQLGSPVALAVGRDNSKPNVSDIFYIPNEGGKFLAQCTLCPNGQCQPFEPASYVPAPSTGGGTACTTPNSCTTASGCLTVASGNFACPTAGQVCCANRKRDETPPPSTPTPTPAATACVTPNSCTTAAGCLTVATGKSCSGGLVCCANRKRDETPPPSTATPLPSSTGTPRPRDE